MCKLQVVHPKLSALTILDGGVLTANGGIAVPTTRHACDRRNGTYWG